MTTCNTIRFNAADGIAHVTLARPEKLNALDDETSDALIDIWQQIEDDPTIFVTILSAEGRHFCAGADIGGKADLAGALPGLKQHRTYTGNGRTRFKPVVGAVQGYALGAGYYLAVRGCDIVVAADDALFGFPEGQAAIAMAPPEYVPAMPLKTMVEFMLLGWKGGRLMTAERAHQIGMINQVVSREGLMDAALEYARLLRQIPPLYTRSVKAGLYRAMTTSNAAAENDFVEFVLPQVSSEDLRECRAARNERRAPEYKGR
ncbi:MAG: enoyl-CoA hydratase/isomerase family protein [Sphingomonas bacterium]